ncbi:MAG: PIG-L family deacetylase, partial [Dehalococcoidia bacterium]|nr:PIG-L family deacetylase [Dehalococcoidia bacterium]
EAIRAFKKTTIIGYEAVWNMTQSNLPLTVGLSSRDIDAKLSSVAAHKSEDYRPYMNPDFIKSLAMVRGLASGFSFGESYEVIRWIM